MLRWQKEYLVDWYGYEDLVRFQAEVGLEFSPRTPSIPADWRW